MTDLLRELLLMSLGGTLAALLLLALRALLRRRVPRRVFYCLWLPVLLRLCLPLPGIVSWQALTAPAPSVSLSGYSVPERGDAAVVSLEDAEPGVVTVPAASMAEPGDLPPIPVPDSASTPEPVSTVLRVYSAYFPYSLFFTLLWAAGCVLSILWFTLGYALFARKVRGTARSAAPEEQTLLRELRPQGDVALLRSSFVSTPLLMGFLRPAIVLPEQDYRPGELECVLRHELTHYRYLDLPFKWFATLVLCLHWFNPISYLIRHCINRDCELGCDETVIAHMSPREKQLYGETLIRLAGNRPLPAGVPATTLCESKEHLRQRLVSIMEHKPRGAGAAALSLLCALLLCGCAAAVGSGSEETAPAPESEELYISYADNNFATSGNARVSLAYATPDIHALAYATDGNAACAGENEVTVSTAEELLSAMSMNTTVILQPGVYDLSEAGRGVYPYLYWKPLGSGTGHQLMTRYLSNLKLTGATGNSADVIIRGGNGLAPILYFETCYNMNFSHLTFQAGSDEDHPGGAVLRFHDCLSLYMEDCVLSDEGGGTELQISNGRSVTLKGCRLAPADASYLQSCEAVLLENCRIEPRVSALICPPLSFYSVTDVCFRRCTLLDAPLQMEDLFAALPEQAGYA